jgi:uncharacterized ion transporter superfamily protein YfcC
MAAASPFRHNPLSLKEEVTIALLVLWVVFVIYAVMSWGWLALIAIPFFTIFIASIILVIYFGKYVVEAALLG